MNNRKSIYKNVRIRSIKKGLTQIQYDHYNLNPQLPQPKVYKVLDNGRLVSK